VKARALPILAALMLAAAGLLLWTAWRGPSLPAADEIGVDLPRLRIPAAACFRDEEHPLLVVQRGGEVELRPLYEADPASDEHEAPWPAGAEAEEKTWEDRVRIALGEEEWARPFSARPAQVLCAAPETPWDRLRGVLPDRACRMPRLYFAGRTAGGSIGVVPVHVRLPRALGRCGVGLSPRSVVGPAYPRGHLLELRITREADRVRYRWGDWPARGLPRWNEGDRSLPATAALAPGSGPMLEDLAATLRRRLPTASDLREIAYVVFEGERGIDFERALHLPHDGEGPAETVSPPPDATAGEVWNDLLRRRHRGVRRFEFR